MTGILKRLPSDFQKLPVLRVHDRRFLGREPKEFGIELGETLQRPGCGHVIRAIQHMRRLARRDQFLSRESADRLDAITQIPPVCLDSVGSGQMRGHPDNRDIRRG